MHELARNADGEPDLNCRWRGALLANGNYECSSSKLIVSDQGVSLSLCAKCYCRDHAPTRPVRTTCKYLGEETGAYRLCEACRGRVSLKVFACEIHGDTTITFCRTCADFTSQAASLL